MRGNYVQTKSYSQLNSHFIGGGAGGKIKTISDMVRLGSLSLINLLFRELLNGATQLFLPPKEFIGL